MTPPTVIRAGLVARTVAHLRPTQLGHRVRLRALKVALAREPGVFERRWRRPITGAEGWPERFVPLDLAMAASSVPRSEIESMVRGRFTFLGEERSLGEPPDWRQAGANQLWRYHLHYWEWAWEFAAHPDRHWARTALVAMWRSWRAGTTFGRWDEWSPYVVSLRAWVLCGLHRDPVSGSAVENEWVDAIALHGGFIAANLELDVGGNHLMKNLKGLIGCGVSLGDEQLVALGLGHLRRQLAVQVLADGGHFERSPSYHAQVLGDLIDVRDLLEADGRPPVPGLEDAVVAMCDWLGQMLMPRDLVPLLGDASPVASERLSAMGVAAAPPQRVTALLPSGYVIARPDARVHALLDVGPPCPPSLPAHAQAGFGSFILHVDDEPVVVDTGVSTYAPGARRQYERSTAAHNTLELDGADQTEVWGTFRAARLARPTVERIVDDGSMVEVVAAHDGYERLRGRPRHRRTFQLRQGVMEIVDEVAGSGQHRAVIRFHLAPGLSAKPVGDELAAGPISIAASVGKWHVGEAGVAPEGLVAEDFGDLRPSVPVRLVVEGDLPIRSVITIRW